MGVGKADAAHLSVVAALRGKVGTQIAMAQEKALKQAWECSIMDCETENQLSYL